MLLCRCGIYLCVCVSPGGDYTCAPLCAGLARTLIQCSGVPVFLLWFVDSGGSCSCNLRHVFPPRGACPSSARMRLTSH